MIQETYTWNKFHPTNTKHNYTHSLLITLLKGNNLRLIDILIRQTFYLCSLFYRVEKGNNTLYIYNIFILKKKCCHHDKQTSTIDWDFTRSALGGLWGTPCNWNDQEWDYMIVSWITEFHYGSFLIYRSYRQANVCNRLQKLDRLWGLHFGVDEKQQSLSKVSGCGDCSQHTQICQTLWGAGTTRRVVLVICLICSVTPATATYTVWFCRNVFCFVFYNNA